MAGDPSQEELGPFQFAVLVLSLALLLALAAELVFSLPVEVSRLVFFVDTAVCGVLFIDFVVRFRAARSKLDFMKWGWVDLLASIPAVEILRFGRILRIVRLLRVIVAIRSLRRFMAIVLTSKARASATAVAVVAFIVVSFGSAGVLFVERSPESNIRTAEDALWWSMTTVTTVGYGDRYPVTPTGRLIATVLMVCGIGIFGTLSGLAAGFFLGDRRTSQTGEEPRETIVERIESLQREVDKLRQRLPKTGD